MDPDSTSGTRYLLRMDSLLGDMDLWTFHESFVTGHYHKHADQLDGFTRV